MIASCSLQSALKNVPTGIITFTGTPISAGHMVSFLPEPWPPYGPGSDPCAGDLARVGAAALTAGVPPSFTHPGFTFTKIGTYLICYSVDAGAHWTGQVPEVWVLGKTSSHSFLVLWHTLFMLICNRTPPWHSTACELSEIVAVNSG
jgi:hypothetical protein